MSAINMILNRMEDIREEIDKLEDQLDELVCKAVSNTRQRCATIRKADIDWKGYASVRTYSQDWAIHYEGGMGEDIRRLRVSIDAFESVFNQEITDGYDVWYSNYIGGYVFTNETTSYGECGMERIAFPAWFIECSEDELVKRTQESIDEAFQKDEELKADRLKQAEDGERALYESLKKKYG